MAINKIFYASAIVLTLATAGLAQQWSYQSPCANGRCGTTPPAAAPKKADAKPVMAAEHPIAPVPAVGAMEAEVIARGNCVSDTSDAAHAGPDAMIAGACCLPESDQQKYSVALYYKEGDAESKALFEDWQTNDKMRVIADPFLPQMPNTFGKFQAICVTDPTQQDLVTANKVERTPCVIIMSPNDPPNGMQKNTVLARVEGYSGDIDAYADTLLKAFRGGVQSVQRGTVCSATGYSYPPKIRPPKTIDDKDVTPASGLLDPQIIVPESVSTSLDAFTSTIASIGFWLFVFLVVAFVAVPLIKVVLPLLVTGVSSVWTWYLSILAPTTVVPNKSVTSDELRALLDELRASKNTEEDKQ